MLNQATTVCRDMLNLAVTGCQSFCCPRCWGTQGKREKRKGSPWRGRWLTFWRHGLVQWWQGRGVLANSVWTAMTCGAARVGIRYQHTARLRSDHYTFQVRSA